MPRPPERRTPGGRPPSARARVGDAARARRRSRWRAGRRRPGSWWCRLGMRGLLATPPVQPAAASGAAPTSRGSTTVPRSSGRRTPRASSHSTGVFADPSSRPGRRPSRARWGGPGEGLDNLVALAGAAPQRHERGAISPPPSRDSGGPSPAGNRPSVSRTAMVGRQVSGLAPDQRQLDELVSHGPPRAPGVSGKHPTRSDARTARPHHGTLEHLQREAGQVVECPRGGGGGHRAAGQLQRGRQVSGRPGRGAAGRAGQRSSARPRRSSARLRGPPGLLIEPTLGHRAARGFRAQVGHTPVIGRDSHSRALAGADNRLSRSDHGEGAPQSIDTRVRPTVSPALCSRPSRGSCGRRRARTRRTEGRLLGHVDGDRAGCDVEVALIGVADDVRRQRVRSR